MRDSVAWTVHVSNNAAVHPIGKTLAFHLLSILKIRNKENKEEVKLLNFMSLELSMAY